ncbi:Maff2 family mobile element protein [Ruthenibacterium lactatiformans]|nr:Maff2 family protein [Ruthenibacterium lactatiformans]
MNMNHSSEFESSAIEILETLVSALGGGIAAWGMVNLLEGYENDDPELKDYGLDLLLRGSSVAALGPDMLRAGLAMPKDDSDIH